MNTAGFDMHKNILSLALLCFFSFKVPAQTPLNAPPAWAKQAIWYQIFVERFYNGDPSNDPKPENMDSPPVNQITPPGWSVTPWTHDWYEQEPWAKKMGKSFNYTVQFRRYGGDLQGVLDKLDYLQDLGVTSIELLPIQAKQSELFLQERNRTNYWGYSTLGYFAPTSRYGTPGGSLTCPSQDSSTKSDCVRKSVWQPFLIVWPA